MNLRDSLILLGATAAVSGFLIPFVLKLVDHRKAVEEKDREIRRALHEKLTDAQASFLDRLTERLWKWRYAIIRVTYYGGIDDPHGYDQAREAYSLQFWGILNDIRVEISRARRLVSPSVLEDLRAFYGRIVSLDRELLAITAEEDSTMRKLQYMDLNHKIFSEVSDGVDEVLDIVANDLHLSRKSLGR